MFIMMMINKNAKFKYNAFITYKGNNKINIRCLALLDFNNRENYQSDEYNGYYIIVKEFFSDNELSFYSLLNEKPEFFNKYLFKKLISIIENLSYIDLNYIDKKKYKINNNVILNTYQLLLTIKEEKKDFTNIFHDNKNFIHQTLNFLNVIVYDEKIFKKQNLKNEIYDYIKKERLNIIKQFDEQLYIYIRGRYY